MLGDVLAFVLEDLDGYYEYLSHPAHLRLELEGIRHLARFEAFDITDSTDPGIKAKIDQVQAHHFAEHPEMAALVAQTALLTAAPLLAEVHPRSDRHTAALRTSDDVRKHGETSDMTAFHNDANLGRRSASADRIGRLLTGFNAFLGIIALGNGIYTLFRTDRNHLIVEGWRTFGFLVSS